MKLEPEFLELLYERGYTSEEDIEEFLSDRPRRTYDPFLLLNMEEGVDYILSAIEEGQKICIYGDYDADGITSTVIMLEVLSNLTKNLTYYIPSRFDEGYGLNRDAIRKIADSSVGLIVTVDCGSVSREEVAYAQELGMNVVVTDHHTVMDTIADCPVINPAQPGCTYPFRYLAGCGVAFKVCQAIVSVTGLPKAVLTRTLDMVAIGTIGDIVSLTDENRTLVKYGLRAINTGERKNLKMLIEAVGLHPGRIKAENVSFGIVPHLNAAGRLVHARIAAEIFLSRDEKKVRENIEKVCELNQKRKAIQEGIFQDCIRIVEEQYAEERLLLIELAEANEGITGIAAGKIKERYYRPTIIVTETEEGICKGTGRSIDGINIYELLKESEELFDRFGGHKAACGFTIRKENVPALRQNLKARMEELDPQLFQRNVQPDLLPSPDRFTVELADQLALLEPCGAGNPRPIVGAEGSVGEFSRIGANGKFLRFQTYLAPGRMLPCVCFRDADLVEEILFKGSEHMVTGQLSINEWNGRRTLQLIVDHAE